MRRIIRFSVALGEALFLQGYLATPVSAQVSVATPSSESTASSLPQAGAFPMTVFLVTIGVLLVMAGIAVYRRPAQKEA